MKRPLLALPLALTLAACDDTRDGAAAFEAGRPKDALAAFAAAAERAGDAASSELLYDVALASLATGDHAAAVTAADLAAARGGDGAEFAALRDFVHGNAAFARAELAEFQVDMPGNSQAALERALTEAKAARDSWQRAASSRESWPAATRNAERAAILLRSLETKKSDLETRSGKPKPRVILPKPKTPDPAPGEPDKPPLPPPPKPGTEKPPEPPKTGEATPADLTREQVARLLERLAEKEREKTAARKAQRETQPPDVEKDW